MDMSQSSPSKNQTAGPIRSTAQEASSTDNDLQNISSDGGAKLTGLALVSSVFGIVILLFTEIWSVAIASVWAVAGVLELPMFITGTLSVIIGAAALWASWHTLRLVIAAEYANRA
jgi:hypothetical protein